MNDTHDPKLGIYKKFEVTRTDGSSIEGGKHEKCRYFVLDLDHDPHAREAVLAYARSCRKSHPRLYEDILNGLDLGEWGELG